MDRFVERQFNNESTGNIGANMKTKIVQIEGKTIKTQIWDTGNISSIKDPNLKL
jgi:GTPase SAR1 family protein